MISRIPFVSSPIILLRIPHEVMMSWIIGRGEVGGDVVDLSLAAGEGGQRFCDCALNIGCGVFDGIANGEVVGAGSDDHVGCILGNRGRRTCGRA